MRRRHQGTQKRTEIREDETKGNTNRHRSKEGQKITKMKQEIIDTETRTWTNMGIRDQATKNIQAQV